MLLAKTMKICCLDLLLNLCCHLLSVALPNVQKSPFFFSPPQRWFPWWQFLKWDTRSERWIILKYSIKQWPCPGNCGPRISVDIPAFPRLGLDLFLWDTRLLVLFKFKDRISDKGRADNDSNLTTHCTDARNVTLAIILPLGLLSRDQVSWLPVDSYQLFFHVLALSTLAASFLLCLTTS